MSPSRPPGPDDPINIQRDYDALVTDASVMLGIHRWKSMGVRSVECECGQILTDPTDALLGFPADELFRRHLASLIVDQLLARLAEQAGA